MFLHNLCFHKWSFFQDFTCPGFFVSFFLKKKKRKIIRFKPGFQKSFFSLESHDICAFCNNCQSLQSQVFEYLISASVLYGATPAKQLLRYYHFLSLKFLPVFFLFFVLNIYFLNHIAMYYIVSLLLKLNSVWKLSFCVKFMNFLINL